MVLAFFVSGSIPVRVTRIKKSGCAAFALFNIIGPLRSTKTETDCRQPVTGQCVFWDGRVFLTYVYYEPGCLRHPGFQTVDKPSALRISEGGDV